MKSGKTSGTTPRYALVSSSRISDSLNVFQGEPGDMWLRTLDGRDNLLGIALGDVCAF